MPPTRSNGRRFPVSVRRTFVVFAALIGLFAQYFVRTVLGGLAVPGTEDALPFAVLDWLLAAVNAPVYWLLGLVYDTWAPDSVTMVALLAYYAVLAVGTSALLAVIERRPGSERP